LAGKQMAKTLGSPRHEAVTSFLIEARQAAGLTQAEVARRLGRHQSFVAIVESGQRRIDVVELFDLAEAIGFEPERLLRRIRSVRKR
jgi:transcriptional regulator with XRE-family HTH domain